VDNAKLVCGADAGADFSCELDGLVLRQTADAAQKRGQVLAIDELHAQKRSPDRITDVVDTTHVRVGHLARNANLVAQTLEPNGVARQLGGQELQRHRCAELVIVGTIDVAHAATAEATNDTKTPGDHLPGRKLAAVTRRAG
jgi:hypothetical protein